METVKVDIQKLQLLNDRITQTIEALNQVRLSVHGIQHSSQQQQVSPWGFGSPYPMFAQPYQMPQSYLPFTPYTPAQFVGSQFPQAFGIQHTSPMTSVVPTSWTPQFTTPQFTTPQFTTPQFTTPFTTPFSNGISHTTWEPSWREPTWLRWW